MPEVVRVRPEPESRSEPWTGAIGRLSLHLSRALGARWPPTRHAIYEDRSVLGPRVDRLLVDTEQQMSDHRPIPYAGWRLGSRAGDAGAAAGFSAAPREQLSHPVVTRGRYGARTVNVRAQQRDPGSLLRWFEQLIRTL